MVESRDSVERWGKQQSRDLGMRECGGGWWVVGGGRGLEETKWYREKQTEAGP